VKILLIDADVVGLDFCLRCQAWGHEIRWWQEKDKGEPPLTGNGMGIEKVEKWQDSVEWADLIIPTLNNKFILQLDGLREAGYPVFGPSMGSRELEVEREAGMQIMEDAGIAIPPYRTFTNFEQAIAHVKKMDEPFACKPLGDNQDKSLTYVAKSPEGLVNKLEGWKSQGKNLKKFILQTKVEGVEFGISRWMGSTGFVGLPNESFEYKKLMPGDYGVNTGETGTVLKYVEKSKLYDTMLKPLEKRLLQLKHRGDIAINCIVDKTGKPNFLEFTARLGFPFNLIVQALHRQDPAQWMKDAIEGKDTLKPSRETAVGFLMWLPQFPYPTPKDCTDNIPIYGVEDKDLGNIHFVSVKWDKAWRKEDDKIVNTEGFCSTGEYLLVVSGTGDTVVKAREKATRIIDKLDVPNDPAIREDVGDARLAKKIKTLQSCAYAEEWRYT
jgi:phosphoribosylamine---glycine ligase